MEKQKAIHEHKQGRKHVLQKNDWNSNEKRKPESIPCSQRRLCCLKYLNYHAQLDQVRLRALIKIYLIEELFNQIIFQDKTIFFSVETDRKINKTRKALKDSDNPNSQHTFHVQYKVMRWEKDYQIRTLKISEPSNCFLQLLTLLIHAQ